MHDYDREGKELIDQGLIDYLPALGSNILPYADLKYFKDRNIIADSLDCSEYESANIIADLSIPYNFNKVIQQRKGNYNGVLDIGTSEHVGNTFASIENALMLLDEGGYYFYDLPYANWMNHGLIQFCPSFFSELCRTNGFEMVFQFIHPTCGEGDLVFVRDNINYTSNCIMSIFGCIRKSSQASSIKAPVQTFCSDLPPENFDASLTTGLLNKPLLNILKPDEFFSYLNGLSSFPLYWSSWMGVKMLGQHNLFQPINTRETHNEIIIF